MSLDTLYEKLAANPDRHLRFLSLAGSLVSKSFADVHADVARLMSELRSSGIGAGDLVGLLGPNSYEWVVADLALLGLECVSVALPVENRIQPDDLRELSERYRLSALLVTEAVPAGSELAPATALLEERPLRLSARQWPEAERPRLPADVFSIAFSSGTSGTKKGLMMTKDGVANTIRTSAQAWEVGADDDILIVMPFSNFQQRYLMYLAIWSGCAATVVAPERLFQQLKTFEPTIILGPPSFFELVYNRVSAAGLRDKLPCYLAALLHAVAPGGAGRRIRARLGRRWTGMYGSRVRLMFTGSAPVPPRVVLLFQQLGVPLFEVYGSTEIGWIAFNLPKRHRTGTAGRPVSGIAVEVADDSEVIVRTEHPQAAGYVFEGGETQQSVFLPEGRIATGDLGRFDGAGFLRLAGRKKNVIITRSGVKINPEDLELDIEKGCRITKAIVASPDEDGLLACVVWLDEWQSAERTAEVESCVGEANRRRDAAHRISQVVFRPDKELTVENGLLTRNFKVDRTAVMREVFPNGDRAAQ
jgi:long-chain acyl-CoA synthetase